MPSGGLKLNVYTVDTTTFAVTPASSLVLTTSGTSAGNPITSYSLVRGRFNAAGHDQIAVTFSTNSGNAIAEIVDFAPARSPPLRCPN